MGDPIDMELANAYEEGRRPGLTDKDYCEVLNQTGRGWELHDAIADSARKGIGIVNALVLLLAGRCGGISCQPLAGDLPRHRWPASNSSR